MIHCKIVSFIWYSFLDIGMKFLCSWKFLFFIIIFSLPESVNNEKQIGVQVRDRAFYFFQWIWLRLVSHGRVWWFPLNFSPLKIANGFTVFKMLFKLFSVLFLSWLKERAVNNMFFCFFSNLCFLKKVMLTMCMGNAHSSWVKIARILHEQH